MLAVVFLPGVIARTGNVTTSRTKITNETFFLVELRKLEPLAPCLQRSWT